MLRSRSLRTTVYAPSQTRRIIENMGQSSIMSFFKAVYVLA